MILLKILIALWLSTVVANVITILVSAKKADIYYAEHPIDYWSDTKCDTEQNVEEM